MRGLTDTDTIARFMRYLGDLARAPGRVYFTGGVTALLHGWRARTIDIDLALDTGAESLLEHIPRLKEDLKVNVELACPSDFIPELPGWRERSLFIAREGLVDFYHYDPYSQALSKIERAHQQDLTDVRHMIDQRLVDPRRARELFAGIEPLLFRYPAIDPPGFRRRVHELLRVD